MKQIILITAAIGSNCNVTAYQSTKVTIQSDYTRFHNSINKILLTLLPLKPNCFRGFLINEKNNSIFANNLEIS